MSHLTLTSSVPQLIEKFRSARNDDILVLTDFDRTLTPNRINGRKISTSPSRFRDSGVLGEQYTTESKKLYEHYYPMEIDPHMDIDLKDQMLHEWWTKHLDLLVKHQVSFEMFQEVVDQGEPRFRAGVTDFFQMLLHKDTPTCICSSGLGDFIRLFLDWQ